jgi:SAM-dependent methyltransferase
MHTEAPYDYICDYYSHVHRINVEYPEVAEFWLSKLGHIRADNVLNVGCGPTLYDYMLRFGRAPREYVGLDINRSTFDFLRHSTDPRLVDAKKRVHELGTHTELIAASVFDCGKLLEGRFDCILGVGFFATFHGAKLRRLLEIMANALRDGGLVLKLTWHGPHRTAEETRKKHEYAYDNPEEPSSDELVAGFENAGFSLVEQEILECDPGSYGWDAIQFCMFRKS